MSIVLETQALSRSFGGFNAVSDVSLSIREGEFYALIGPNGAGKSTLFSLLSGFLPPSSGRVLLRDLDITGRPPAEIARRGLVRSFQISALFPEMTVRENLRIPLMREAGIATRPWLSHRSLAQFDDRVLALAAQVGLEDQVDAVAGTMSYGRRRALELATTLALDPDVLLLDEPLAGMGAEDVARIAELIRSVGRDRTVVMVEHNLSVVADLCDRITVLQRGRELTTGTYDLVSADPRVRSAYMGEVDA